MKLLTTAAVLGAAAALPYIPHRARGGLAWKQHLESQPAPADNPPFTTNWYNQTLDHFDDSNMETFPQRYYVEDAFASDDSDVIFLYIGGEGPQESPPFGYVDVAADEFDALVLTLEHRYYGESVPGNSLETDNLKWLSAEQALADLNGFSQWYEETALGGKKHRWVAVGGSYPGALAGWYRVAYPDATVATWSSSGVVNAIFEFTEFDEGIAESVGDACADVSRRALHAMQAAFDDPAQQADVTALMNATNIEISADWGYAMADGLSMAVQYGSGDVMCEMLADADKSGDTKDLMNGFADMISTIWGPSFASDCFYDTNCLINDPDQWQPTSRSWRWQKCSELAYLQDAPAKDSLRSEEVDMDALQTQCSAIFGDAIDTKNANSAFNKQFGGAKPDLKYTMFWDGSSDPWRKASVQDSLNDDAPLIFAEDFPQASHCKDLHAPSDDDSDAITKSREQEMAQLHAWLD